MSKFKKKQIHISGSDIQIGNPTDGDFDVSYLNPSMSISDGFDSVVNNISASTAISASYAVTASYAENAGGGTSYWTGSVDYISRDSDVKITGSLFVSETGSFQTLIFDDDTLELSDIIVNGKAYLKDVYPLNYITKFYQTSSFEYLEVEGDTIVTENIVVSGTGSFGYIEIDGGTY